MCWKSEYESKICTAEAAARFVKSGDRVVFAQMHGVSQILVDALCARKDELMDVTVFSSLNANREWYMEEGYAPNIKYLNGFLFPQARKAYKAGLIEYFQVHFHEFPTWLKNEWKASVAMPVLTPPDEEGYCSFSLNGDFMVAACESARDVVAHINPCAPRTFGAKIHVSELRCAVVAEQPLYEVPMGRAGEVEEQIARHIAPRIPDGACLQLGIGGIPDTVLSMLGGKKDLGIHTEMFADGVVELAEKGSITGRCKQIDMGKIVTTFIMGSKRVHEFVHNNPDVLVLPVDYTNDPNVIAQNDNLVSINSCLEVDLFGQVNADSIGGGFYSGIGGQVDFVRGANMSRGGQSFMTLPSTALGGTVSTIVPLLKHPVTTSRHDVRSIVTEYGIADLFGKTMRERAQALIDIAHPEFREELTKAAYDGHFFY
jgi:Acetyl-CoA hydrolase